MPHTLRIAVFEMSFRQYCNLGMVYRPIRRLLKVANWSVGNCGKLFPSTVVQGTHVSAGESARIASIYFVLVIVGGC